MQCSLEKATTEDVSVTNNLLQCRKGSAEVSGALAMGVKKCCQVCQNSDTQNQSMALAGVFSG